MMKVNPSRSVTGFCFRLMICALTLFVAGCGALLAQRAEAQTQRVRIKREPGVPGALFYRFLGADRAGTTPRALPAPGMDGLTTLEIPARYAQPGALLTLIDTAHRKVARFPVQSTDERALLGPDRLQNGDFTHRLQSWEVQSVGDGKIQGYEETMQEAGIPGNIARFRVSALGSESWHTQVFQPGLDFSEMRPCTITFRARADRERPIKVCLQSDTGDYHVLAPPVTTPLKRVWQKYSVIITPSGVTAHRNRLGFLMNASVGTVDLADIHLHGGAAGDPPGTELLLNGNFRLAAEGWKFVSPSEEAQIAFPPREEVSPPAPETRVLRCTLLKANSDPWKTSLNQSKKELQDGAAYTLSLWAKADRQRAIQVAMSAGDTDQHFGVEKTLTLSEEWQKFTICFTASDTTRNSNQLQIALGGQRGTVDLADVSLREGVDSQAQVMTLAPSDFDAADTLKAPLLYRGSAVRQAVVTLTSEGTALGTYQLQDEDYGVARFYDVPLNKPLLLTVACNGQQTAFPRSLAPDGARVLAPLDLPAVWTSVPVIARASPVLSLHPLLGTWEELGTGGRSVRYAFTFLPDGTLVMESSPTVASAGTVSRTTLRWGLMSGRQRVTINGHPYTWSAGSGAQARMLHLSGYGGQFTLYRN